MAAMFACCPQHPDTGGSYIALPTCSILIANHLWKIQVPGDGRHYHRDRARLSWAPVVPLMLGVTEYPTRSVILISARLCHRKAAELANERRAVFWSVSVFVGCHRQARNAGKMRRYLASEGVEEGDDVRYVIIAQGFSELEACHHTHGIV